MSQRTYALALTLITTYNLRSPLPIPHVSVAASLPPLVPSPTSGEQLDALKARLAARLAEKAGKKDKKRSAAAAATAGPDGNGTAAAASNGGGKQRSASPPAPEEAAAARAAAAKRLKVPEGATKEVYASIFSSNRPGQVEKETFCCRALSARGMNLT